jgi:hypothetical protein
VHGFEWSFGNITLWRRRRGFDIYREAFRLCGFRRLVDWFYICLLYHLFHWVLPFTSVLLFLCPENSVSIPPSPLQVVFAVDIDSSLRVFHP